MVLVLLLAGCENESFDTQAGSANDTMQPSMDSLSYPDLGQLEDSKVGDTLAEMDATEDTETPLVKYTTPDLAGERIEGVLHASGSVAVQPAVAVGSDGEALIIFAGTSDETTDLAIYAVRPGGTSTLVKSEPGGQRNEPAVCSLANGGFVAVWSYDGQSVGNPLGIEGAILGEDGSVMSHFNVTTEVPGNHWLGHVGCNPEGGFTVVGSRTDTDDTTFGVFAQHYDASGSVLGAPFTVNPNPDGTQVQPVVALGKGGAGLVLYEDAPTDGNYMLTARSFGPEGVTSDAMKILSLGGADAQKPALAISAEGHVAYAGNLNTQLHLLSSPSIDSPDAFKGWLSPLESRFLPAISFLDHETHLVMASLANVVGAGEPSVIVEIFEVGSDVPLSNLSLGSDPKLPPYPPAVAWGGGTLAVAWTQRTDDGFEIHLATFVGAPTTP